mmetsp:Transcript_39453/g.85252  ORF Transcript_39453/g.85252 Transcript_39453/m.85252 type:complete len:230 (+) Transcript_39453:768-1457(+)
MKAQSVALMWDASAREADRYKSITVCFTAGMMSMKNCAARMLCTTPTARIIFRNLMVFSTFVTFSTLVIERKFGLKPLSTALIMKSYGIVAITSSQNHPKRYFLTLMRRFMISISLSIYPVVKFRHISMHQKHVRQTLSATNQSVSTETSRNISSKGVVQESSSKQRMAKESQTSRPRLTGEIIHSSILDLGFTKLVSLSESVGSWYTRCMLSNASRPQLRPRQAEPAD